MHEQLELGYVFGGLSTFGQRPFLTDPEQLDEWQPDVAIVGAPFDIATTNRPGARFGPRAIRSAGLRSRHLPHRPRHRDLRPPRGRRLRRRLLPARTDRGQPHEHPRAGPPDRLARHRADRPRRRPLDHLAGRDGRRRRPRLRQRRRRPLRCPRRHRRHHRRQPRQPRHADSSAHRVGGGTGRPIRPGRPARLLAAGRDLRLDEGTGTWSGTRCRRSGTAGSRP